jgi:hypothetical protein
MCTEYQRTIQKLSATGNSARTKTVRDKEVMHSGYRCVEHNLPCGVAEDAKYGCTD